MPVFDITAPDGTHYEVTGPEGSTEEQALQQVQAQHGAASKPSGSQPSFGDNIMSELRGVRQGLYDIPQSAIELGARGTDAIGLTDGAYPALHNEFKSDAEMMAPGINSGDRFAKGGRIGGQIAGTLPAVGLRIPGAAAALPRLAPVLNGALQGATSSALTSSSSDAPLGSQVGLGAAAGGALPMLAKAASSVISPAVRPAVKALLDRGIPLTPGQILGGAAKGAEDKLSSLPIIGDMIKNGQRNSVVGLNRAAYNDALAPIGQTIPNHVQPGRDGVAYVESQISKKYDSILPQMRGTLDPQLVQDVTAIAHGLRADGVTDETITRFQNVIEGQLAQRANNSGGMFAGDTLKGIQGDLGRLASHHGSSADSNDRALGSAIGDVQSAFNDMLLRQNPQFSQPLQEANQAWAQYARIRRAASSVGSKDGVFSPAQYANAVKASDKSVGKGAYAKGRALQQDLSDPANQILPGTVPDSGTPGRLMMAALLGAPAYINPALGAAGLAAGSLYTKPGQKLAALALAKRPAGAPALAGAVRKYGALGAPALGALIPNLGQ